MHNLKHNYLPNNLFTYLFIYQLSINSFQEGMIECCMLVCALGTGDIHRNKA